MRTVPLLGELRTKGGTLNTFSTTTNDFAYLLSNSDITVVPSHFALLKLPDWENTLDQSLFFDGTFFTPAITDPNLVFPKVIQNYLENMLAASDLERNDNSLGTYAEQAFFKMLRLLGGIEFVVDGSTVINGNTYDLFKEDVGLPNYTQVVKYVGQTNMINHRRDDEGNEYIEVFVHVPTEDGLMTGIQFVPKPHITHASGLIPQGGGDTYSSGLDSYAGAEQVEAIYDTGGNEYEVGNDLTDLGIDFDFVLNDTANHKQGDFDFNAILLFYTATDSTGVNTNRVNGWGLHTLDNFDSAISGVSKIPTLTKYQPDNIQSGNSFNFKMNLAFSAGTLNIATTVSTDFSFNEWMDVADKMNNTLAQVQKIQSEWAAMQQNILNFSAAIGNFQAVQDAITQIGTLTADVERLKSWQGGTNNVRITNEELFMLFQTTVNAITNANGDVKIYPILSSRTFLPKIIDPANLIGEYNGQLYQWNASTGVWDVVI